MCGALVDNSALDEDEDSKKKEEGHIPQPFLEDHFEPLEWTHVLATLDACTNEAAQIKFYGKEGHAIQITTLNMIKVHCPKEPEKVSIAYHKLEEILVWDKNLSKGDLEGTRYDASSEKSDDERKLKKTKEGPTRSGRKLKTRRPGLCVSRDKKSNKDMGIQEEHQTPSVATK